MKRTILFYFSENLFLAHPRDNLPILLIEIELHNRRYLALRLNLFRAAFFGMGKLGYHWCRIMVIVAISVYGSLAVFVSQENQYFFETLRITQDYWIAFAGLVSSTIVEFLTHIRTLKDMSEPLRGL